MYEYNNLFIDSGVNGHLDCFQFLDLTCGGALNILIHFVVIVDYIHTFLLGTWLKIELLAD